MSNTSAEGGIVIDNVIDIGTDILLSTLLLSTFVRSLLVMTLLLMSLALKLSLLTLFF